MIKGGDFIGLKFIDLFAGIGGFRLGLEKHGHKCVGWCEKDKFAQKSYRAIHDTKGEWFADDITDVQPRELPEADVYCGGFPCQSFSIAGERGGFDDIRGTLIFEILRLAKERQPKYLFLENVKGLLNHDKGATFSTILKSMAEVGYDAEWQVLNSKNFGVPQNRERVFIIGHLGGFGGGQIFPIRGKNSKTIRQFGNIVDDSDINFKNPQRGRVYNPKGISPTLNCMEGGGLEPKIAEGLNTTEEGDSYCVDSNYNKGTSPGDINSGRRTQINHDMRIRKLTPKECWRLQGFPDWAFKKAAKVNSDSQLYRQAGNSVTIPVIYEIARRLEDV